MLNQADNERLTRVGAGTPAGELFRRYWQPVLLASELPERDGAPVRVRILGEDLVAFRDSEGNVGLVDAFCPHRRAPLFFGRNEECGLRCVYHGWKFDRHGTCVDMPSEPRHPERSRGTLFKTKVTVTAYPTWEGGQLIWAYLGPASDVPPPPDYEWLRVPPTHLRVSKTFEDCNYLQALEGGIDNAHASFVHNEKLGDDSLVRNRDRVPKLEVRSAPYGMSSINTRDLGEHGKYVRVMHFVMPAQQMRGGLTKWSIDEVGYLPRLDGHIWLPIDDEHTFTYNMLWTSDKSTVIDEEWYQNDERRFGRAPEDMLPGFRLKKNKENDYMVDRQMQKTRNYTGIVGINTQDYALQEGMGTIVDRSLEHLGTSDKFIIDVRRRLLEQTHVVEAGERPAGLDPDEHRSIRPYDAILPREADWESAFAPELVAKW
jgi:nitrite reductase/ring-hydroxylating ferredoxin subunit